MKDGLGQELSPGNKVVWVSGKGNYAGVEVFEVERLTEKRVKLVPQKSKLSSLGGTGKSTYVAPTDLVVVDKLL